MPALTFSLWGIAGIMRVTRSSVLDVIRCEYMRTARAKGLAENILLMRHALRNAAIPIVTVLGLHAASSLAGAVIAEQVFAWPGIGRLAIEAVNARDYAVVQGVVIVFALVFSIFNIVVRCSVPSSIHASTVREYSFHQRDAQTCRAPSR